MTKWRINFLHRYHTVLGVVLAGDAFFQIGEYGFGFCDFITGWALPAKSEALAQTEAKTGLPRRSAAKTGVNLGGIQSNSGAWARGKGKFEKNF
jgi:hypothetical protein